MNGAEKLLENLVANGVDVCFSNSMANLHNAKRAHTPVVNIVGDHATYHL